MPPFEIVDKVRDIGSMKRFVICVDNEDYPVSLELHKLYRILPDDDAAIDGDLRIVDESGEDYLYPAANFVVLELPNSTEQAVESSFTRTPQMCYAAGGVSSAHQVSEGAAPSFVPDIDSLIDQIAQLPDDLQEKLIESVRTHRIESARKQIAADAQDALALFRAGKLRAAPVDEVIASLEAALSEPEE